MIAVEPQFVLLHGRGGSPKGSVFQLEQCLRQFFPTASFERPALLHGDPKIPAEESLAGLEDIRITESSVVIGISLGGLIAARLQETKRKDLRVFCISSPTWAEQVKLDAKPASRVAFYSSNDAIIADRVQQWPQLAQAWDIPWLNHDTDRFKQPLAELITASLRKEDVAARLAAFSEIV